MNEPRIDGLKIRLMREAQRLSVHEVADAVGISENMMYKIEDGQRQTRAPLLKVIADYFGVTVDSLYVSEVAT